MTLPAPRTLLELEQDVSRDLELVAHPRAPWLAAKTADGAPVLDALVIGAGQCGIAVAHALKRDKVDNLLVIDRATYGREGPWVTYGRMKALRSLKDQTGPDLRLPSLTYQAWHEASFGTENWARMRWIPKELWNDYLLWFRRVTGIPVRNGVAAGAISPIATDDGLPALRIETSDGAMFARKVVLATGQEGIGGWWMPPQIAALPRTFRAHTNEMIDFAALRDKVVAVLGAGASAFDNAAVALEHGAAEVHLFCRRAEPMVVQPYRWLTFAGFLRHMGEMPDEWRWRFMSYILGLREGFAQDHYDRVIRHANFHMHVGREWEAARVEGGRVVLTTPAGPFVADYCIAGTGVRMDPRLCPELTHCADNIARWQDRYTPPPEEANERLGQYPYLNADSAFLERRPGETPWIGDIHLFGIGTTMSFGPSGSSINAMSISAPRVAAGVTRGLFEADLPRLYADLRSYGQKQVEIDPARLLHAAAPA
ncbi:NAD(P)-binding domain-containing protein [Neoroseomonas eburnea]|uniref:NAD(P)-binding domain-containing protein n=1 Tax=Neoroseomonas eburnea TaxID=1346889 RepID=UPI001BA7F755